MVNDVRSNGVIVRVGELELRDAMLKFRGPGTGNSEGGVDEWGKKDEVRRGSMMSVSVEKDECNRGKAFTRPFWMDGSEKVALYDGCMVTER